MNRDRFFLNLASGLLIAFLTASTVEAEATCVPHYVASIADDFKRGIATETRFYNLRRGETICIGPFTFRVHRIFKQAIDLKVSKPASPKAQTSLLLRAAAKRKIARYTVTRLESGIRGEATLAVSFKEAPRIIEGDLSNDMVCAQTLVCGEKNGVRKIYSTPCAALQDGATFNYDLSLCN